MVNVGGAMSPPTSLVAASSGSRYTGLSSPIARAKVSTWPASTGNRSTVMLGGLLVVNGASAAPCQRLRAQLAVNGEHSRPQAKLRALYDLSLLPPVGYCPSRRHRSQVRAGADGAGDECAGRG